MDLARIEQLLELVARSRIAELQLSENGTRIRIVKATSGVAVMEPLRGPLDRPPPAEAPEPAAQMPAADSEVFAPTYGVFHRAPAPGAAPFTEVGARVEAGQTLCVVEAMKTFIPIEAEMAGTVIAIPTEDAAEVAVGQVLFRLKPDERAA